MSGRIIHIYAADSLEKVAVDRITFLSPTAFIGLIGHTAREFNPDPALKAPP
jgi:hypothetical protein